MKHLHKIALIIALTISMIGCAAIGKTRTVTFEAANASQKQTFYCGALTKQGKPCHNKVKAEGEHCHLHGGN
jgi:outer membrane lipoprotein SlyB